MVTKNEACYVGIDLGTTNLKVTVYDGDLGLVARESMPVRYQREGEFVEFDADAYVDDLLNLTRDTLRAHGVEAVAQLALTGQAESLVVLGADGRPLMNAISWMDERSTEECALLEERFPPARVEAVTGQAAVLPTWPATKILWLRRHRPDVYAAAGKYMLLKDYVVYRLTGRMCADCSIATFSLYFDIYEKCYWREMLEAIGVREEQLPPLVEPCTVAGSLTADVTRRLEIAFGTQVNVGTLDHFAGMIGTGNARVGTLTLSTGTVMALAAMSAEPAPRNSGIAMHYGFLPDTHVMLPVVESGGVSLEWFRNCCMPGVDYARINEVLLARGGDSPLIFLPYIAGVNAPEFDKDAAGAFWGLRQEHDAFDMARAVMEGVAFTLRKNCDYIAGKGTQLREILATGGGSKSPVWCQLQADITGLPVLVPEEREAACLGAAMIAAVAGARFRDFAEAAAACVRIAHRSAPHPTPALQAKYRRFCRIYQALLPRNLDRD